MSVILEVYDRVAHNGKYYWHCRVQETNTKDISKQLIGERRAKMLLKKQQVQPMYAIESYGPPIKRGRRVFRKVTWRGFKETSLINEDEIHGTKVEEALWEFAAVCAVVPRI